MQLIFNDIASSEVLLILVFVLIFFGSKSIPGLAKTMGKTIRQIKDASSEIQDEIKKSGVDIKKDMNLKGIINDTVEDIKRPLDQHIVEIDNAIKYSKPKPRAATIPKETVEDKSSEESLELTKKSINKNDRTDDSSEA